MTDTTATELYHNLLTVLTDHQMTPAIKNKVMHETLILICAYGLRNSHFAFGDLNAQTERLILQAVYKRSRGQRHPAGSARHQPQQAIGRGDTALRRACIGYLRESCVSHLHPW